MRIFILIFIVMGISAYASARPQMTVCSATINSSDEIQTFRKKLDPNDFKFVELTKMADLNSGSDGWFDAACDSGIQCDVLIISGHYGGAFFGADGKFTLNTDALEKKSCQRKCDGIISHPKEVYLFGCNTLAGKDKDSRTPERYFQVLVDDGVAGADAQRIVASRYGPFGSAYKDRIERSFESVPAIYGFSSVAPSGQHVRTSVANYLDQVGDFYQHLQNLSVTTLNTDAWMKSMSAYNRAVGIGITSNNPAYAVKKNMCELSNEGKTIADKIDFAASLMLESPLLYLPTFSHFVNHDVADQLHADQGHNDSDYQSIIDAIDRISKRGNLKNSLLNTMSDRTLSVAMQIDFLKTKKILNWISNEKFSTDVSRIFENVISHPTIENADLMCSLVNDYAELKSYINKQAVKQYDFSQPGQFQIASCLSTDDVNVTKMALDGFEAIQQRYVNDMKWFELASWVNELPGLQERKEATFQRLLPNVKWRGSYTKAQLESVVLAPNVGPEEQMRIFKEAASGSKPGEDLRYFAYEISSNPFISNEIIKLIWQSAAKYGFAFEAKKFVRDSQDVQDVIARAYPRLADGARWSADEGLQKFKQVRSTALVDALITDAFSNKMSSNMSATTLVSIPISESQFQRVLKVYESLDHTKFESANPRLILYHHRNGHPNLDPDISTGTRWVEQCTERSDGTEMCTGTTE